MLPMAKPGLISVGIFNFLGQWNQYLLPTVLNTEPENKVLSQGLVQLAVSQGYKGDWSGLFAGLVMAMLPVLAAYIIFQRQVVAGLTAAREEQQFDQLIADGVKVIALDPVDAAKAEGWVKDAKAKGVKVVAYDRAVPGADAYVSHDNNKVGELQGQALLTALGAKAATANVVMINGDEKDPNAALFKKGAHTALDGKVGKIAYEASGEWDPKVAGEKMSAAISSVGKDKIGAVYSANDGMAGGIITSLENAGVKGIPVGGQDAEVAGVQRIIAGSQTFTIYKSPLQLAPEAAKFAVNLLKGKEIGAQGETDGVPSTLFAPVVVDKTNIQSTVVKDGIYKAADLCTADLAAKCTELGIK
ncbi:hypothetical protein STANM309S_06517 [Streptomyces tanashiensis]